MEKKAIEFILNSKWYIFKKAEYEEHIANVGFCNMKFEEIVKYGINVLSFYITNNKIKCTPTSNYNYDINNLIKEYEGKYFEYINKQTQDYTIRINKEDGDGWTPTPIVKQDSEGWF